MYEKKYHTEDLSKYSFLVTGGAGFIGSNLVEYLLKYGAKKVRILDDFSTGSNYNIVEFAKNSAFELIEGDIRDLKTCRLAMKGMDYVSHQAALGSVPRSIDDPITTNEVNINGFLNILEAIKDVKSIVKMVYAASSSTYGDSPALPKIEDKIGKPLSPYAVTKFVNELYADVFSRLYSIHAVGLRYFNVFGPRQNPQGPYAAVIPLFIKAAIEKKQPVINGDGEQTRDFTFVENAVQANIRAMLNTQGSDKHEVLNIAVGNRTTLNQLWTYIKEIVGIEIKPYYGASRIGDVQDSIADISKARSIIGYNPTIQLFDGLLLTHEWFIQNNRIVCNI